MFALTPIEILHDSSLPFVQEFPLCSQQQTKTMTYSQTGKRIFDILLSLCLLGLLAPLLLVIACISYCEYPSYKHILFIQSRVGLHGQLFRMFKFRSMLVDADQQGPYYTSKNDPRITRWGRFLRKTSLDELPQLLNVLKGEMSLVGPRPNLPIQRQFYSDDECALRCAVRPGITGLAQATLRSQATLEQGKYCDLQYAKKPSFWFDVKILLLTINQVLRTGSY